MPFVKGDKRINYAGRPKGSKNKLTIVKDNLVKILSKRLQDPKELAKIDIKDLIRFVGSIVPKDMHLKVAPDVRYISQTPRPDGMITHDTKAVTYQNETKTVSLSSDASREVSKAQTPKPSAAENAKPESKSKTPTNPESDNADDENDDDNGDDTGKIVASGLRSVAG